VNGFRELYGAGLCAGWEAVVGIEFAAGQAESAGCNKSIYSRNDELKDRVGVFRVFQNAEGVQ